MPQVFQPHKQIYEMRVRSSTPVASLAGSLSKAARQTATRPVMVTIGAQALNVAVKAAQRVLDALPEEKTAFLLLPSFDDVTEGEEHRTTIHMELVVIDCRHGHPVTQATQEVLVNSDGDTTKVAGCIAGIVREGGAPIVKVIGAGALNVAIKAIAVARGFLAPSGYSIYLRPRRIENQIDGEDRTSYHLEVVAFK